MFANFKQSSGAAEAAGNARPSEKKDATSGKARDMRITGGPPKVASRRGSRWEAEDGEERGGREGEDKERERERRQKGRR